MLNLTLKRETKKQMTDRRIRNFSPGPAMLPDAVMQKAQEEFYTWNGRGVSVLESSHRGKDFLAVLDALEANFRELMGMPDDYSIMLVQGGASLQFALIPMNFFGERTSADYLLTGSWSEKAYKHARMMFSVRDCSGASYDGSGVPAVANWERDPEAAYMHFAYNETIHGVMFPDTPDSDVPLVCDASSCILSLPMDVSKYGCIYAGTQKNLGPAGLAVVIASPEMMERSPVKGLTPQLSYAAYAAERSLQNTAPTFTIYMVGLMLEWVKEQGGVAEMHKRNQSKAKLLYDAVESSNFYANPVLPEFRSICNIPFTLPDGSLDDAFLEGAERAGLANLRGHRSVGGMRASIYNAMPEEGVRELVDYMKEFERLKG